MINDILTDDLFNYIETGSPEEVNRKKRIICEAVVAALRSPENLIRDVRIRKESRMEINPIVKRQIRVWSGIDKDVYEIV